MNSQSTMRSWSLTSIARDLAQAWRLLWDPNVPTVLKVLLPGAAFLYWLAPDLMPGLPFDDIAVWILALRLFAQMADRSQTTARNSTTNQPSGQGDNSQDNNKTIDTTWRVIDE